MSDTELQKWLASQLPEDIQYCDGFLPKWRATQEFISPREWLYVGSLGSAVDDAPRHLATTRERTHGGIEMTPEEQRIAIAEA